jgi:hypothetical protein
MTPKPAPRAATWFLKRFSSYTEDESVLGDLSEQYQRGRGSIWYWRQVLSIVYMGLFREFRSDKRRFIGAFVSAWCVWGVLQFTAGMILGMGYVLLHPAELLFGIEISGFPLLTLHSGAESKFAAQWGFVLFALALNVLPLFLVGKYCARTIRIHPRTMLLAFITTYVVWDAGWMATNILVIAQHQQIELGLVVIRDLVALPLIAVLIFLGGRRGLSPVSPVKRVSP